MSLATRCHCGLRRGSASDETWDRAEQALREALVSAGADFEEIPNEGAFYGPKIDLFSLDALRREWQLSTFQLDFNLPERFDLEYVTEDNTRERPVMIHRAILGSLERFFGVLLEHNAGAFPGVAGAGSGDDHPHRGSAFALCGTGAGAVARGGAAV